MEYERVINDILYIKKLFFITNISKNLHVFIEKKNYDAQAMEHTIRDFFYLFVREQYFLYGRISFNLLNVRTFFTYPQYLTIKPPLCAQLEKGKSL